MDAKIRSWHDEGLGLGLFALGSKRSLGISPHDRTKAAARVAPIFGLSMGACFPFAHFSRDQLKRPVDFGGLSSANGQYLDRFGAAVADHV